MAFQDGCWGWCKELGQIKDLQESTLSSSGTLLAWDKGFLSLSLQVSETEAHSSWETGNSVVASFIGFGHSSVIALSPQKLTLASQWPISSLQQWPPSSGPHIFLLGLTSSRCFFIQREWEGISRAPPEATEHSLRSGVSKSPPAHRVYVSSSKSFDSAEPHTTPNACYGETLLVRSQQHPNRPPNFLTIWALPSTGKFSLSLCSSGNTELWFEVTSKEKQSDVW